MDLPDSNQVPRDWFYSGTHQESICVRIRDCHPLRSRFPSSSAGKSFCNSVLMAPRPRGAEAPRFRLSSFSLAATGEVEFFFPFLRLLRCFSSPACRLLPYGFRQGHTRITTCGFPHSEIPGSKVGQHLPRAYRSRPRPSSALGAKASTVCPSSLDHEEHLICRYGVFKVQVEPLLDQRLRRFSAATTNTVLQNSAA